MAYNLSTVSASALRGNQTSGLGIAFNITGGDVAVTPPVVTGVIKYVISATELTFPGGSHNNPALFTETLGNITGYTRTNATTAALDFENNYSLAWPTVWNKYVYFRIEITIDGVVTNRELTVNTFIGFKYNELSSGWFSLNSNEQLSYGGWNVSNASINTSNFSGFLKTFQRELHYTANGAARMVTSNATSGFVSISREGLVTGTFVGQKIVVKYTNQADEYFEEEHVAVNNQTYNMPELLNSINVQEVMTLPGSIGIHGSLLLNGHIWGSTRNGDVSYPNNLVKIPINDYSSYETFSIVDSEGVLITRLEQLQAVGDYIYAIGENSELVQINSANGSYKVFALPYLLAGVPLLADDEYLYFFSIDANSVISKYRESDFRNPAFPQFNSDTGLVTPVATYTYAVPSGTYVHSCVEDETYIYAAYTSGTAAGGQYILAKIRKSDLTIANDTYVPKATDDMTQNADWLFLGIENPGTFGNNYGALAVRKSDFESFPILQLASDDTTKTSYASLIFGNYLLDAKTNNRIYVLDITDPSQWDIADPVGTYTLRNLYADSQVPEISGVINDLLLDYDTQTFHGFVWVGNGNQESQIVKFKINGLEFQTAPDITTLSAEPVATNVYNLRGAINSSGGVAITEAGFQYGTDPENLASTLPVVDYTPGNKSVEHEFNPTTSSVWYYRFYAVNSIGTTFGNVVTVELEADEEPDAFVFNAVNNAQRSTVVTSNTVTIAGITSSAPISVANGEYSINGGAWTAAPGLINLGDTVQVRQTSSADYNTTTTTVLTIGGVTSNFAVTTVQVVWVMEGTVRLDGVPQQDATIILIDIIDNNVVDVSQTDANGLYSFTGLSENKSYLLTGYKGSNRIYPKIKVPYEG